MNEIIDAVVERFGIPAVDGQRIRATFCDAQAIHSDAVKLIIHAGDVAWLSLLEPAQLPDIPAGYTPYQDLISGLRGAFCQVYRYYFPVEQTPQQLLLLPEKVGP